MWHFLPKNVPFGQLHINPPSLPFLRTWYLQKKKKRKKERKKKWKLQKNSNDLPQNDITIKLSVSHINGQYTVVI